MYPGLIFGDAGESFPIVNVSTAVAHARNQEFRAGFERRYQCGTHSLQAGVAGGCIHDSVVRLLERSR